MPWRKEWLTFNEALARINMCEEHTISERTFEKRIHDGAIAVRHDDRGRRYFHPVDVDHLAVFDVMSKRLDHPDVEHRWYHTLAALAERANHEPITQNEIDELLIDSMARQDGDNEVMRYPPPMRQWNHAMRSILRHWPDVNALEVAGAYWFFAEVVGWRNGAYDDDNEVQANRVELRRRWLEMLCRMALHLTTSY